MAWTLENYFTIETLDDPKFIKWYAYVVRSYEGVIQSREIPVFPCRDEDLEKFYPVDEHSQSKIEQIKAIESQQLYCIDWEEANIELFGAESTQNYAFLEISAVPCNLKLTLPYLGGTEDRISEDCVWDLEAQQDYIRPPNLIAYYNQERLNVENYDEESIERYSTLSNFQFDEKKPTFVPAYFYRNQASDQTNWLRSDKTIDRPYNQLQWESSLASAHTKYPTREKPDGKYKFVSFDLYVSFDSSVTERETYGLLEWLGDIGGLTDALRYLGQFLIMPIASYSLKVDLLSTIFRRKVQLREEDQPQDFKDLSWST